jgi:hypothetical protein
MRQAAGTTWDVARSCPNQGWNSCWSMSREDFIERCVRPLKPGGHGGGGRAARRRGERKIRRRAWFAQRAAKLLERNSYPRVFAGFDVGLNDAPLPAVEPIDTLEAIIDACNRLWEARHEPPRPQFVSPWMFDYLTERIEKGKPHYLARLRADLNQRRRREALPPTDPRAFEGIHRTMAPGGAP